MSDLNLKLKEFSQAIRETKEYQAYQKAAEIYKKDQNAQQLLKDFQTAQQNVNIYQQGSFSGIEEQKKEYENLLKEVRENKAINDWIKTQKDVQELVGVLAAELSQEIDFKFTPPEKRGCCG
ncbi:MAG: YlbF family regulator [Candidatus Moranbacteria bacterium]|nr:YlbF family regulator [Candidatus Moranbacteria bacterium]